MKGNNNNNQAYLYGLRSFHSFVFGLDFLSLTRTLDSFFGHALYVNGAVNAIATTNAIAAAAALIVFISFYCKCA